MYERTSEHDYYKEMPQDLKPLKKLDGWKFSKDATDIRGWNLVDRDGNEFGKIDDLLMSTGIGEAIFGIVSMGVGGKHKLIPLDRLNIDKDNKRVLFSGLSDQLKDSPDFTEDMHDYRGIYDYWSGTRTAPEYRHEEESKEFRHYVSYPEGMEEEEEEEEHVRYEPGY